MIENNFSTPTTGTLEQEQEEMNVIYGYHSRVGKLKWNFDLPMHDHDLVWFSRGRYNDDIQLRILSFWSDCECTSFSELVIIANSTKELMVIYSYLFRLPRNMR